MEKLIFDGKEAIFGRLASEAAKNILRGNSVEIINCEEIIVSGDKYNFLKKIQEKKKMGAGSSLKGPNYSRLENKLIKRMIRGMLPWDRQKGRDAYRRLRCHIGKGNLKETELKEIKNFNARKPMKYFSIKDVTRLMR